MSKNNKPAAQNRADEIKGLLLDVIQQEDSQISESQVIRLSQPYKSPKENLSESESEKQREGQPDLGEVTNPRAQNLNDSSENEKTHSKIDIDISAKLELEDVKIEMPKKQFQVKAEVVNPEKFPVDKTVKMGSQQQPQLSSQPQPQSHAPLEMKKKLPTPVNANESTIRLNPKFNLKTPQTESRIVNGSMSGQSKFAVDVQASASSPTEAILKQSESLKIAQSRINSLEDEIERMRRENSQLSSAGEILKRRADELLSQSEIFENKLKESEFIFEEEKKVLKAQLQNKEKDIEVRKQKIEQLEQRVNTQFESIRRRERELEHRLEILKIENQDILNGKDKMILDLKRQVDLLNNEANYSKERTQELYNQHKNKQETIRRVVKALRMALTILEGDEESQTPLKKVD